MKIARQNPSGAYCAVQTWPGVTPPDGWLEITADTAGFFNGYIIPTIEDGKIVSFVENVEDHKAWADAEAAKPKPVELPTTDERLAALEDAVCESDAANDARMAEIENALCELDGGVTNG